MRRKLIAASVAALALAAIPGERALAATPAKPPVQSRPAAPGNFTPAHRTHVRGVVIHKADGPDASRWFQNPAAKVSAHYDVHRDGTVYQSVADHDIAWHAGNWPVNVATIGVEHEGLIAKNDWTEAEYRASARLVAYLCVRYAIPIDRRHVYGHSEVPDPFHKGLFGGAHHHEDPGPSFDWSHYMALVKTFAAIAPAPPPPSPGELLPGAIHRYTEFDRGLTGACGPNSLSMCRDWSTRTYKGNRTWDMVQYGLAHGYLTNRNGISNIGQLRNMALGLGLPVEATRWWDSQWPDWKSWFRHELSRTHIVLWFTHAGQALVDEVSGKGENAHHLENHVLVACGYHAGGWSAHAGRSLPEGFWCADGDNFVPGDRLVFYSVARMSAALPSAAMSIGRK